MIGCAGIAMFVQQLWDDVPLSDPGLSPVTYSLLHYSVFASTVRHSFLASVSLLASLHSVCPDRPHLPPVSWLTLLSLLARLPVSWLAFLRSQCPGALISTGTLP